MTALEFDAAPTPDDTPDAPEHVCKVCGVAVFRQGTSGRFPEYCPDHKGDKRSSRSTATTPARTSSKPNVVDAAADSLLTLYQGLLFPLSAISPVAGLAWSEQIAGLDQRNRLILAANPKLAKQIVDGAAQGGTVALVMSHVMAIAPVGIILVRDIRERRATVEAPYVDAEA